jgi:hypothetical protein
VEENWQLVEALQVARNEDLENSQTYLELGIYYTIAEAASRRDEHFEMS